MTNMSEPINDHHELAAKIRRLVEERGWNQEDFARTTGLNRHTVRQILAPGSDRKLRNATIGACAEGLGVSVNELRTLPLERLLPRMSASHPTHGAQALRKLYDQAWQGELKAWLDRNPDRARELTPEEIDEILALQGPEGPLGAYGVDAFIGRIERRRRLLRQVTAIAGTEFLDLLEQLVGLLHEKIQPSR
jgi:transcriptional regulator with XRE-family HTH domain